MGVKIKNISQAKIHGLSEGDASVICIDGVGKVAIDSVDYLLHEENPL